MIELSPSRDRLWKTFKGTDFHTNFELNQLFHNYSRTATRNPLTSYSLQQEEMCVTFLHLGGSEGLRNCPLRVTVSEGYYSGAVKRGSNIQNYSGFSLFPKIFTLVSMPLLLWHIENLNWQGYNKENIELLSFGIEIQWVCKINGCFV